MKMEAKRTPRLSSLDALRGAVMILMALDHVRDFVHKDAMTFSPTDLAKTSTVLFLTRWITHFCLPVFMFTAGAGAFLWWRQGHRTNSELSRFLWTRGLWLVALELTVMRLAYNFSFSAASPFYLLILWIFGLCMITLALLVHLPFRALAVLSVAIVALHDCLDGVNSTQFGSAGWLWNIVHQPGLAPFAGKFILVTYPLLPWIGVMAGGFCFAAVFAREAASRQRIMVRLGLALTVAFIAIRAVNRYGDPAPWSPQKSAVFTALSFLNCTKYPASLDFLLMTLGPALLLLAYFDKRAFKASNPLIVFGRVPLFYFVLHFYLIHSLAVLLAWIRYGGAAFTFMFNLVPSMGGPRQLFPSTFGYSLWVAYGMWLVTIVLLYPVCRWFASVKATRRDLWLKYL